nr:FprA family A-type flavoprotein [Maliibacterium massiliense]
MKRIEPRRVAGGVTYVGAVDAGLRVFDVVMHTPYGTTYNAYLVQGKEKCALVEVVKDAFGPALIDALGDLIDIAKLDYIVLNHTEPDHSGALAQLLKEAPDAVVVCSRAASVFLRDITNMPFAVQVVGDGDSIDLGGKTLQFISAPFLHWPDTMFTYIPEEELLITGDVFGCHYAIEADLWSDSYPTSDLDSARKYYFDAIMGPFKSYMRAGIEKARRVKARIIAPSHGPLLREEAARVVDLNAQWAAPEEKKSDKKRVFIGYVSCYGFTRALAMRVREAVEAAGLVADCFDVSVDFARAVRAAMASDAIILGSPTINRDALKPVWDLTCGLSVYAVTGRPAATFGSYGWSGEAPGMLQDRLASLGMRIVADCLRVKFRPTQQDLDAAYTLGQTVAAALETK